MAAPICLWLNTMRQKSAGLVIGLDLTRVDDRFP